MSTRGEPGPRRDLAGGLDAVEVGHADVHQHDLGMQSPRCLDGLCAVARFCDHLEVRFGVQDDPEASADKLLIVGDQDADGHGWVDSPARFKLLARGVSPAALAALPCCPLYLRPHRDESVAEGRLPQGRVISRAHQAGDLRLALPRAGDHRG